MLLKMNENHWIWNKRLGFQKRSTSLFFVGLSFSFPFSLFSFLLLNSTYRVVLWNLFRILVLCCIFNLITPIIEWSQLVPPSIFILLLYKLSRLSFASFKCVEFSPFLLRVHLPFFVFLSPLTFPYYHLVSLPFLIPGLFSESELLLLSSLKEDPENESSGGGGGGSSPTSESPPQQQQLLLREKCVERLSWARGTKRGLPPHLPQHRHHHSDIGPLPHPLPQRAAAEEAGGKRLLT